MRNGYSRTAEVMAALRALEQFQPAPRRIICDPYASEFLIRPSFKLLARSRWLANPTTRAVDVWAPGALEFLTIRARLSDEIAGDGRQRTGTSRAVGRRLRHDVAEDRRRFARRDDLRG